MGWVLMRALMLAIPDEVAQYAEGHRITSYFALGRPENGASRKPASGDSSKPDWLWTTITKGQEPYEFDSFRVFVWSRKHHRYETAYIERKVVGHYPVEVDNSGAVPRFSLILEGDDGRLFRKTYTFEGYRVRMIEKQPYQAAGEVTPAKQFRRACVRATKARFLVRQNEGKSAGLLSLEFRALQNRDRKGALIV